MEALLNPRLHGNGFIQYDLPNNHRLHIFHPELVQYGQKVRTEIHTHMFDMRSHILYGELNHLHYKIVDGTMYNVYTCNYGMDVTPESTLTRSELYPDTYGFKIISSANLIKGSSYFFRQGEWHSSSSNDLTVTLIQKRQLGFFHNQQSAMVACVDGLKPDNDYSRTSVPQQIIKKYTSLALDVIDHDKISQIIHEQSS